MVQRRLGGKGVRVGVGELGQIGIRLQVRRGVRRMVSRLGLVDVMPYRPACSRWVSDLSYDVQGSSKTWVTRWTTDRHSGLVEKTSDAGESECPPPEHCILHAHLPSRLVGKTAPEHEKQVIRISSPQPQTRSRGLRIPISCQCKPLSLKPSRRGPPPGASLSEPKAS